MVMIQLGLSSNRAVLALHSDDFSEAQRYLDISRECLDTELTALIGEGYNRAYRVVVEVGDSFIQAFSSNGYHSHSALFSFR